MLRCFEDDDITHVEGRDRPRRRRRDRRDRTDARRPREPREAPHRLEKKAKGNDKEAKAQLVLIDKALELLREGKPARQAEMAAGG